MFKPRLQRLKFVFPSRPIYFITACTHERRGILAGQEVHRAFTDFAAKAPADGVFVGRYVIMPDHFHLFAAFAPDALPLSLWLKSLKNSLSKTLRRTGLPGVHWQKGFFDHVMRSAESYELKWLYVQQNPVRAGLVQSASDWPYQGEIHPLCSGGL